MAIRYKLREDYKDGDLLRGRDVNKITHRVNELDDKVISIDDKADLTALTEYQEATEAALQGKQDVLTAGDNITIQNNVISASQPDLSGYALSADVATELAKKAEESAFTRFQESTEETLSAHTRDLEALDSNKQDKLTAGDNITIENNVISAQQPSLEGYALSADVTTELAKKQDKLTAGTNITIQNNVISAQQPDLSPYALASDVQSAISQVEESKQDKLSAGTNITIQDNVISAQQPDLSPYALSADVTTGLAKKTDSTAFTAYTASTAQQVNGMAHEIDENASAITELQSSKQDVLSAGTGINIQNNVISLDASAGAVIDDTATASTTVWSSQKTNQGLEALQIELINLT